MTKSLQIHIREAKINEYSALGQLMVKVYAQLDGFPSQTEQPAYYQMLADVGRFTKNLETKLLVAVTDEQKIVGGVVYFSDMQYYGAGGTAKEEKNASGFRLLAVDPEYRGLRIGKNLTQACIDRAKQAGHAQVLIHTTQAMQTAWGMYEKMGFKRSPDLDFLQENLAVFGFSLKF